MSSVNRPFVQLSPGEPVYPSGGAGGSDQPQKPQYSKRGKITIVACVPCRKRKTKCDGKRPACSQCQARDGNCSYDMTDDQRKLTFLRENVEQLQEKSNTLESLLSTVQSASDEEAREVFRRLRGGADVHGLADLVHAGKLLSGVAASDRPENKKDREGSEIETMETTLKKYETLVRIISRGAAPQVQSIIKNLREQQDIPAILDTLSIDPTDTLPTLRQNPSHSPSLENNFANQDQIFGLIKGTEMGQTHVQVGRTSGFDDTKIKHGWTTVTSDPDFVNYLLDLYFTWQHSFFQNFPEDLFRADMSSGRTKYCSSILVNAICAAGCFLSHNEEIHQEGEDGKTWSLRFYYEAIRLLGEIEDSTITTTASMFLISYVDGTRGRLSALWNFSGRSTLMAVDINLHLRRKLREPEDSEARQEQEKEQKARSHAFWGCFHVDQLTSFTLGRLPKLNINGITAELPQIDHELDQEAWTAVGYDNTTKPHAARSSTFHHCSTLSAIVNSTLCMFFAPSVPLSGSLLLAEYQKYLDWKAGLPELLSDHKNSAPHVICLHMYYEAAVLLLFRPFLRATIDNSEVVPRDICRQSAVAISDLWDEHRRLYDSHGIFMFQVHCLLTACTIHIINFPSIKSTTYFSNACRTFHAIKNRNAWAASCITILRELVVKWRLILPREAEDALQQESDSDKTYGREGFEQPAHDEDVFMADHNPEESSKLPTDEIVSTPTYQRFPQEASSFPLHHSLSKRSASGTPQTLPEQPSQSQSLPSSGGVQATSSSAFSTSAGPKRPRISGSISSVSQSQSSSGPPQPQHLSPIRPFPTSAFSSGQSGLHPSASNPLQPAESFLYSPLADQPAPLLVPGGGISSQRITPRPTPWASTPNSGGQTTGTENSSEARAPSAPQDTQMVDTASGTVGDTSQQRDSDTRPADDLGPTIVGQIEGMTFGDDWRDPFMGFLG